MRSELDAIASVGNLQQWGDDNGALIAAFRADWQKALRFRYTEKLAELQPTPPAIETVMPARIQRNLDRLEMAKLIVHRQSSSNW